MICDLAETYGIFDYRRLPASLLSTLVLGLRDDSRVKMAVAGMNITPTNQLLAIAVDYLAFLFWAETKNGQKGRNKPKSVYQALMKQKEDDDIVVYSSAEEFNRARERILRGG